MGSAACLASGAATGATSAFIVTLSLSLPSFLLFRVMDNVSAGMINVAELTNEQSFWNHMKPAHIPKIIAVLVIPAQSPKQWIGSHWQSGNHGYTKLPV
jgi:hypothetical protein